MVEEAASSLERDSRETGAALGPVVARSDVHRLSTTNCAASATCVYVRMCMCINICVRRHSYGKKSVNIDLDLDFDFFMYTCIRVYT